MKVGFKLYAINYKKIPRIYNFSQERLKLKAYSL
jgi:hypothetical protein